MIHCSTCAAEPIKATVPLWVITWWGLMGRGGGREIYASVIIIAFPRKTCSRLLIRNYIFGTVKRTTLSSSLNQLVSRTLFKCWTPYVGVTEQTCVWVFFPKIFFPFFLFFSTHWVHSIPIMMLAPWKETNFWVWTDGLSSAEICHRNTNVFSLPTKD